MRILLLVAALGAAGCGSKSGGHCRLGNTCEDHPTGDLAAAEKECTSLSGEWSGGSCPAADEIGTCTVGSSTTRHYYGGGANAYTKDNASANCEHELHGTWKAK